MTSGYFKMKLDIMKDIRKNVVTLKPDKRNGLVLVRNSECYSALENVFPNWTRFKRIEEDLKPARLTSIQRYLKQLNKKGKLPVK